MQAGKLNKRLSFQSKSASTNSFGESAGWSEYYKCWGSVTALRGQLAYQPGEFISKSIYSISIRDAPSVTISVADHIVCDGVTFEIQAILDKEMRHRELQLLCYVVNEAG